MLSLCKIAAQPQALADLLDQKRWSARNIATGDRARARLAGRASPVAAITVGAGSGPPGLDFGHHVELGPGEWVWVQPKGTAGIRFAYIVLCTIQKAPYACTVAPETRLLRAVTCILYNGPPPGTSESRVLRGPHSERNAQTPLHRPPIRARAPVGVAYTPVPACISRPQRLGAAPAVEWEPAAPALVPGLC